MDKIDDEELITLLNSGHTDAVGQLYGKYQKYLINSAALILKNKDDAKDVVQEFFSRMLKKKRKWDIKGGLKVYLYIAIQNECLNWINKKKKTLHREQNFHSDQDQTVDPAQGEERREEEDLNALLSKLSEKDRHIYDMYYRQELDQKEIAQHEGCSVSSIKKCLFRIRELLKSKKSSK